MRLDRRSFIGALIAAGIGSRFAPVRAASEWLGATCLKAGDVIYIRGEYSVNGDPWARSEKPQEYVVVSCVTSDTITATRGYRG